MSKRRIIVFVLHIIFLIVFIIKLNIKEYEIKVDTCVEVSDKNVEQCEKLIEEKAI